MFICVKNAAQSVDNSEGGYMLFKKYNQLKRLIQGLFLFNVALVVAGAVAAVDYYKTQNPSAGLVVLFATLVFWLGFVWPYIIFKKLEKQFEEKQQKLQKHISEWVALWIKSQEKSASAQSEFWIQFALASVEVLDLKTSNPYFQFAIDILPVISKSLNEQSRQTYKKRKAA